MRFITWHIQQTWSMNCASESANETVGLDPVNGPIYGLWTEIFPSLILRQVSRFTRKQFHQLPTLRSIGILLFLLYFYSFIGHVSDPPDAPPLPPSSLDTDMRSTLTNCRLGLTVCRYSSRVRFRCQVAAPEPITTRLSICRDRTPSQRGRSAGVHWLSELCEVLAFVGWLTHLTDFVEKGSQKGNFEQYVHHKHGENVLENKHCNDKKATLRVQSVNLLNSGGIRRKER